MSTKQIPSVYDRVVEVTEIYLGSSADRFIAGQVENHLHKSPANLSCADLRALIDWISVAASLLIEDNKKIDQYVTELNRLARDNLQPC